jgi:pilus assembly protein CpaD
MSWNNCVSKDTPTMPQARLWLTAVALAALAACASHDDEQALKTKPVLPTEQYAIDVAKAPEVLRLSPHSGGLSPNQAAALRTLADRWADSDHGDIAIRSPTNTSDPAGVFRTAKEAHRFLIDQGVDQSRIQTADYVSDDPKAPIIISFLRYQATGPNCGLSWSNIAVSHSNQPYPEFGCSITANIAAQVSNSEDLIHPRTTDPSDANRRETVLGLYRQGAATASAEESQANGGVATGF